MAAQPARRLFTVREYYRMGKAGILTPDERVELMDGEIVQMPPIGSPHASCVRRYTRLFSEALGREAEVSIQNPIRLGDRSEPVPDVVLLRPRADAYAAEHPTPADVLLLVEVSDRTLAYDERTKLPVYAREQVPEVWLTDLGHQLILAHREPTVEGYRITVTYRRGERIAPLAFPDHEFLVDDILG
jgi:Uma2 family endonuclease